MYVVVNFSSQVTFIFPLFQLHQYTLPYPKTKQKVTGDKKLTMKHNIHSTDLEDIQYDFRQTLFVFHA